MRTPHLRVMRKFSGSFGNTLWRHFKHMRPFLSNISVRGCLSQGHGHLYA
jgi:hypothetical protein